MNPHRPLIPGHQQHELLARFFAAENVQQVLQCLDGLAINIGDNIPTTESLPLRLAANLNKRYQNPFRIRQMEKRRQLGVKTLQVHPPLLAGTLGRRRRLEIHRAYGPKDFLGHVDGGFSAQGKGNGIRLRVRLQPDFVIHSTVETQRLFPGATSVPENLYIHKIRLTR